MREVNIIGLVKILSYSEVKKIAATKTEGSTASWMDVVVIKSDSYTVVIMENNNWWI
jgi:hypothetical protein